MYRYKLRSKKDLSYVVRSNSLDQVDRVLDHFNSDRLVDQPSSSTCQGD